MIFAHIKIGIDFFIRFIKDTLNKNSLNLKPNFIISGFPHAGTTTLYYYLKQHPEIYFSKLKEPHFFTQYYEWGENWYLSHFKSNKKFPAVGEATPNYCNSKIGMKRMYKFNPEFKLIIIMRNPVERLYSNYKWFVNHYGENLSFENFISYNQDLIPKFKYCPIINNFLKYFSKKNLFFLIFEKFIKDPNKYLKEICEFLDVNSKFKFDPKKIYQNRSLMPMSLSLQKINQKYFYPDYKEPFLIQSVKITINQFIIILNCWLKLRKFPELKEETRLHFNKYYKDDILNLEKLLNIELDEWKKD